MIPNKEQALELLKKYNSDPFHIKHGLIVSGVMEYFAKELGYADDADFWGVVGLRTISTLSSIPNSTA